MARRWKKGTLLFRAMGNDAERRQGKLTLGVIREQLQKIVQQRAPADANIHYLDGRELYGLEDNVRYPLPDELHPEAEAHRLIGERFCALAFRAGAFCGGVA